MAKPRSSAQDASKLEKKSFWTTIPGILTGLAALITAITGTVAAVRQTGVFELSPVSRHFSARENATTNALLSNHREGNYRILISHRNLGGYGGLVVPPDYQGKQLRITAQFQVIEGSAQVIVDDLGVGPSAASEWVTTPFNGVKTLDAFVPEEKDMRAGINLKANSKVLLFGIKLTVVE